MTDKIESHPNGWYLKDDSLMPWGAHKGKKMANVPARYLLCLYDNHKRSGDVRYYIEHNMDALRGEASNG